MDHQLNPSLSPPPKTQTVLAYTEDLRTFLKSERGRYLATFPDGADRPVVGEDLRPMHDEARKIVDDAVVSDIPLLYSPGQIGLAAMMLANDNIRQRGGVSNAGGAAVTVVPDIDMLGYVRSRFEDQSEGNKSVLAERAKKLCDMLRGLKEGQYCCGNHGIDMARLKVVHKKMKKAKAWTAPGEENETKKKKKKKKRKAENGGDETPASKAMKSE